MSESVPDWPILLLTGRVRSRDEAQRISALVFRLRASGADPQVCCLAGRVALALVGCPALEFPWLENRWLRPIAARQLRFEENFRRPRLIHALDTRVFEAASMLSVRWRVPLVVSVADYEAWNFLSRSRLLPGCQLLIAEGESLATEMKKDARVDASRVRVIPTAIKSFASDHRSRQPDRLPVIGTAGPWSADAGILTFFRAAREILDRGLDVEFVVAGEGPLESEFRRQADQTGVADRMTFAPSPAPDDPFWKVVDVYCQPASGPTVGHHLAVAMCAGLPVVATDVPGLDQLLHGGRHGLIVSPGDADGLSRAVARLLERSEADAETIHRARAWATEEFDPEKFNDRLWSVYQQAEGRLCVVASGRW